jgi:hypothetical protein
MNLCYWLARSALTLHAEEAKWFCPQQHFFCMPFLQLAAIRSVLTGTQPSRPYRPACYVLVGGQRWLTDSANAQGAERRLTAPDLNIIVRMGPADRLGQRPDPTQHSLTQRHIASAHSAGRER